MNPISTTLTSQAVWTLDQDKNSVEKSTAAPSPIGTASGRPCQGEDVVSISPEAQVLSAKAAEQGKGAAPTQATQTAPAATEYTWGPDLIEGWNDENYLRQVDGGFVGSLSMTTANGTKVGVAAEVNEDGSPANSVMVTIQAADGTVQQHRVEERTGTLSWDEETRLLTGEYSGGFLRITETENGIEIDTDYYSQKDTDDIIITLAGGGGGGGNDTLVGLGGSIHGGDGDDTLVHLSTAKNSLVSAGAGDDTLYIRKLNFELQPGTGNNTINIDTMTGSIRNPQKGLLQTWNENDVANNVYNIGKMSGSIVLTDRAGEHNETFNIGSVENAYFILAGDNYTLSIGSIKNADIRAYDGVSVHADKAENVIALGENIAFASGSNSTITNSPYVYNDAKLKQYRAMMAAKEAKEKPQQDTAEELAASPDQEHGSSGETLAQAVALNRPKQKTASELYTDKRAMVQALAKDFVEDFGLETLSNNILDNKI